MSVRDLLARNLRLARKAAGLSQEDLAGLSDLDRTYISSLERGRYAATIDVLEKLAEHLDLEPSDLISRKKPFTSKS